MRIAIIATYRHPSRLPLKERTFMQPAAPELLAALCPPDAEIEIYNEKEIDVPLDRHWDLVFFSYLHSYYEHTKVLSTVFRNAGMTTVAGGRHASHFPDDCRKHFDAIVLGDPEANVPRLVEDFREGALMPVYNLPPAGTSAIPTYRYDLIDWETNRRRGPALEASRGCPFACDFCVLTGQERYRYRPVAHVIRDITGGMRFNRKFLGLLADTFVFYDNNLGGSPRYLRELCEALIPLRKTWGCAATFNILEDDRLLRLMSRAGCRYIYTGIESFNPESLLSMNKRQNRLVHLKRVLRNAYSSGIMVSTGLLVGSDGDTNEYLARVPEYLDEIDFHGVTFLGIVCPYPGTPFYERLASEGRLLPGLTARDLDGFTVCHRPKRMDPSEVADHYRRLSVELSRLAKVSRHVLGRFGMSDAPGYKWTLLLTSRESLNIRRNTLNEQRSFIAGEDPIEAWDAARMRELGLAPQAIG